MIHRLLCASVLWSACLAPLWGQVQEYELKAALLYNLAKFVQWPSQSFHGSGDPVAICIVGENPFGRAITEAVEGRTLGGRVVVIREVSGVESARSCQMLFVSASERKRFQSILANLRASPVLTVGDSPGFAEQGGVANLLLDGGKVRIEINLEAAREKTLQISSKLLSLAQIVKR